MKNNVKRTLLVLSLVAVVMLGAIAGTIAWLTASTDPVTNTFTVGDINITLTEPEAEKFDYKYHLIPGMTKVKDPTVTVEKGSEKCYVYVEVTAVNLPSWLQYSIDANWVQVEGNVYRYKDIVDAASANQVLTVLTDSTVKVSDKVTKDDVDTYQETLGDKTATLSFKAFAHQSENTNQKTADDAAVDYFAKN